MFTLCVSFSACDHGAALVGEPPTFVKRHSAPVATCGAEAETDDVVVVVLMLPGHTDTSFAAGASLPLSGAQTTLVQHTVDAIQLAARPVVASPNELHPDAFIAEARAVAQRTTSKITAIQRVQLRDQGFGGIYGVGKAATHKPALVCLSHVPEGAAEDAKGVTMVGKGVIFDTGGPSIKTGGAAALLAAFEAACHAKNTTDKTPRTRCCVWPRTRSAPTRPAWTTCSSCTRARPWR
ncbi:hypothetical protein PF002_g6376 [Phytophthora fragariae]|nr:hypothetical protein PF011_g10280 [Phytophthora fragariae]KAE9143352.1 hypothetical protein PF006_g11607 [Phytophthora fragariae]KAE9247223.1 hypothetical protein PF002_g6376 [Phytophthora fragariae]